MGHSLHTSSAQLQLHSNTFSHTSTAANESELSLVSFRRRLHKFSHDSLNEYERRCINHLFVQIQIDSSATASGDSHFPATAPSTALSGQPAAFHQPMNAPMPFNGFPRLIINRHGHAYACTMAMREARCAIDTYLWLTSSSPLPVASFRGA